MVMVFMQTEPRRHEWRFIIGWHTGPEKGDSETSVHQCGVCGALRVNYVYGDGQASPNYPVYSIPGKPPNRPEEPRCVTHKGTAALR